MRTARLLYSSLPGLLSLVLWARPGAAESIEAVSVASAPPAANLTAEPEVFQGISDTELQVLFQFGPLRRTARASAGAPIITFNHFSTFQWGSNFFFLDVEGQPADPKWHFWDENSGLYFEYAPSLSLTKIGVLELPDASVLRDISLTPQLNIGYAAGGFPVNRTWLGGVILSWAIPGFVTFETQLLARAERTYDVTWQLTIVWFAPFRIGDLQFEARGFFDMWRTRRNPDEPGTENKFTVLAQPQFIVKVGPLFLGVELDIRHDFPRADFYADKRSSWDIRLGPMVLFDF